MSHPPDDVAPGLSEEPVIALSAWVHHAATLIGDVTLEEDVSVWPGAVLRGDRASIRIGARTNVQDGTLIHCDPGFPCEIGRGVTIGHRAVIHGCTIEDGALIGIGAIVLNGAVLGAGSLVAAGAVVGERMEVPRNSLVVGVPAKVLRPLNAEQKARVAAGVETYVRLKELHRGL
jgi:carbonic anhydrase/acetyltransferase-like protein (isoleucine patch superfamily)